MAETTRRLVQGHGSDVVRRLIARPIRMQAAPPARSIIAEPAGLPEVAQAGPGEPVAEPVAMSRETAAAPNVERLRTEMLLLKAVLKAERRENASLRVCVGLDEADASLGAEARAVRDRWAVLVDRLLHAPA